MTIFACHPLTKPLLIVAGVAFSAVALAGTRYVWDAKSSAYKGVSGASNNSSSAVELTNEDNGVLSLSITEKYDNPCLIKVTPVALPGASSSPEVKLSSELRGHCDGIDKSVTVGAGNYATAIQVCTNGASDSEDRRIKGVRLWGASVGADGKLTQNRDPSKFELPNCADWSVKESCGDGQIVTGLKGYYQSGSSGSYSGIAIRCSKLVAKNR